MSKEYRSLEKIVVAYESYKRLLDDIAFNKEALNGDDDELRELAKAEVSGLEEKKGTDGIRYPPDADTQGPAG